MISWFSGAVIVAFQYSLFQCTVPLAVPKLVVSGISEHANNTGHNPLWKEVNFIN